MKSQSDVTRCTVHDGAVWMHLDNARVHIPSHISNKSQILVDALSGVDDNSVSKNFTLAAPKEWLHAWMACRGGEEERLRCAGVKDLVNCLLVRVLILVCSCGRAKGRLSVGRCRYCLHSLSCAWLHTNKTQTAHWQFAVART
jgi:hypothetical protein